MWSMFVRIQSAEDFSSFNLEVFLVFFGFIIAERAHCRDSEVRGILIFFIFLDWMSVLILIIILWASLFCEQLTDEIVSFDEANATGEEVS